MDSAFDPGPAASPRAPLPAGGVTPPRAASDARDSSLMEPLERLFGAVRRMASDYAQLAVMDVRRAAIQLAWLVAAGIIICVLVVTAWLALVVALAVWLLGAGMSWPGVLAVAAVLNLIGAGLVVWRVKGVFEHAPFSATLRQLKSQPTKGEKEP
jgi:uncharacterized membrane protein YqjE